MRKKRIILLIIALAAAMFFFGPDPRNGPPPLLTHNFVNLDSVFKISKFRSCQGHVVVPTNERESRRNMKHYFRLLPEYVDDNKVEFYAPFDGKITDILAFPNEGLEGEVWIGSDNSPWTFSIEHLLLLNSLKKGDHVKAGQLIGYSASEEFDIVYAIGTRITKKIDGWNSPYADLDSVFNHMADEVFSKYQARGIAKRDNMIWSKSYRDKNPCEYRDKQGGLNDQDHPEDWVFLK